MDAWHEGAPVTFPVAWPDPGEELIPRGAHGLVADGQLWCIVVGKNSERYTRSGAALCKLELPFAELMFKQSDGTCSCHGMIWESPPPPTRELAT